MVLLAHGSQRGSETVDGLKEVAHRLQRDLGPDRARVVLACLEFIHPDLIEAVHELVSDGVRSIVVMPYLLGQGRHPTVELEERLGSLGEEVPGVELLCTAPLGSDPRLVEMVVERVAQFGRPPTSQNGQGPAGVLIVKAGTRAQYDDCAWFYELAQRVEERLGAAYAVAIAQSHYGPPTMEEAAATLVEGHGASSLVCVPYLFFPGMILRRNILGGVERLRERHQGVPMMVTPTLGVDDRLVSMVVDRVRDAWRRAFPSAEVELGR